MGKETPGAALHKHLETLLAWTLDQGCWPSPWKGASETTQIPKYWSLVMSNSHPCRAGHATSPGVGGGGSKATHYAFLLNTPPPATGATLFMGQDTTAQAGPTARR